MSTRQFDINKFYPSSSAFAFGSQTVTDWSSGCPRYLYLEAMGLRIPFPEANRAAGATYEALKGEQLIGREHQAEVPFKCTSPEGFIISGRIDYILEGGIIELKSCNSPSSKTKHLSKGIFTIGNLGQITTYMLSLKIATARLIYGEVKINKETKELAIGREVEHIVSLENGGEIYTNGQQTRYTVASLYNHRRIYHDALFKNILPDRPFNESKFNGPCGRCPWNATCTIADARQVRLASEFLTLAIQSKEPQNDSESDDRITTV